MEDKFIRKLIRNYFYQYKHDSDSVPLSEQDYKVLIENIKKQQGIEIEAELHEIINDVVYEYLTT
ncbi:YqzH family protein [Bacillus sp. JJ1562]|uniref:YqzH family protein n=1 Tax=Bacillus sp. JJ1562 TaxID=3122960 RepID=UPI003002ABCF